MDDVPLTPELLALDLALIAFPRQRWRSAAAFAPRCICKDDPMYTLSKAKEEIDTVAKHAADIAGHVIGMSDDINARLESFKKEILSTIEDKFNELGRKLHGDAETVETTAVNDLGEKVSLLIRGPSAPAPSGESAGHHDPQPQHEPEPQHEPAVQHESQGWDHGHQEPHQY